MAIIIACLVSASAAHADARAKTTTLSLARSKTKPVRLLVKGVDVESVRPGTPCVVRLVITPQHTLFKRMALDITIAKKGGC